MKKSLFLATTIATASLFTGCSNNEYVGDQPEAFNGTDGAIVFSMGKANTTRAGEGTRQLQSNGFYVYGEKYYNGTPETPQKVFDTYKVQYKSSDNDKSASNTKGWEYVGIEWGTNERKNVAGENATAITQTIKYWDYRADHYTFYAFSANPEDVNSSNPNITVSEKGGTSADPSYTVSIKEGAHIEDLYFADKKEVTKTGTVNDGYAGPNDNSPADKAVKLTFRNLASKVRVGFYETVPGYSIQITKMYKADANGTAFGEESTANFVAMCPNYKAKQNSRITVKYSTKSENKDRAYVADKKKYTGNDALPEEKTLTLGGNLIKVNDTPTYLATTSSSPTWDNGGDYTFFWPQTGNTAPLKIKVDYTLTSTDGSNETITVTGATATVPADYVKWAANTAYTYIFKISDNTNGTTGSGSDPAGLYPITFDAAVVDMTENTYLTTVSTPSVTVSQNGTNFVNPGGLKFKTGTPIELKVTDSETGSIIDGAQITGGYINVEYKYDKTPEQNLSENGGGINNSVTLTQNKLDQQGTAGYWVLKVAVSSDEGAAFTYVIIRVDAAEEGPETNP